MSESIIWSGDVQFANCDASIRIARCAVLEWKRAEKVRFTTSYQFLRNLFGVEQLRDLSPAQLELCELFGGPNGWIIYKILEARGSNEQTG